MSRKTRVVLAVIFIEAALAGLWFFLARMGAANPAGVAPEFQQTLGSTMGTVMGALLGFGVLLFFIAARNDRNRP